MTKADPTFKQLFTSWKKLDQLAGRRDRRPVRQAGQDRRLHSGYGVRSDPFRGRAAMHAGIDLAGPVGTPIYATADGIVLRRRLEQRRLRQPRRSSTMAAASRPATATCRRSWSAPGQRITRGQLIGRMGSTGRSTGSHLHYEVRIDGRAVNPIPFMKSTDYLLAMQRKNGAGAPMDAVALGGPNSGAKR